MNTSVRRTFRELFEDEAFTNVEIPIIQRDYAQGRKTEQEVRTQFLDALYNTLSLPEDAPTLPLDLDFIYGSLEGSPQAFCPLDGQQRLTTLFLLHWYLACKDGKSEAFQAFIRRGQQSRFTYKVRPSSKEFFDAMVGASFDLAAILSADKGTDNELSMTIADSPWFFLSWHQDPTIQSALEMLDAIHHRFKDSRGFYDRLVQTKRPYITFQFLNLHDFGLSDDLYIKMNARGKPLTTFESFKARLEQHLDTIFPEKKLELHGKQVSVRDYFSHRIDTAWADLFWHYRDPKTHLFDDRIMNLIRALVITTRDPDNGGIDRVLQDLRNSWVSFSFLKYQEHQCLDTTLIDTFISAVESWSESTDKIRTHLNSTAYYDEKRTFERVVNDSTRLSYEDLVQFHAYCAYLRRHRDNLQAEPFGEWMRVICNLAVNTIYDQLDDFKRSIRSVNELLNESNRIIQHLSGMNVEVQGFNEQQIREEKLKAQLILRSNDWRSLILKAEQHGYFKGQIEFLFKFSGVLDRWVNNNSADWSTQEDAGYRREFANYFAKAATVFSADGLNDFGESRWERALLSIGDYLLPKGSNYSFLTDSDRDASWKRLLRGAIRGEDLETKRRYVKDLLDQIDLNIGTKESLNSVIEQASPTDEWRGVIVDKYEMIKFCRNRMIRLQSPNCVYLLKKIRMSGEHAELFTYDLKVGLLSDKRKKGELAPFGEPAYHTVNTDSEQPYAYLIWTRDGGSVVLEVFNQNGAYELKLSKRNGQLPDKLKAGLATNPAFKTEEGGLISRTVDRKNIEEAIDEVVSIVREFANTPTP